jgi:DNA-binding phage protein
MNTEKIEKLKKGLTNSQIPESLREKIREQIKRLETEDNASKPAPKEEAPVPKMAKAPTVRKSRAKKTVEPKKETVGKTTAMSLAKEIRKDGEKWTDAVKRAGMQMKKGTTEVKKTTKTEMQKLLALVKRRKDLKGLAGKTNIPRDAVRKALPSGKRTSATGKVYYENRANRTDKGKVGNYYLELGGTVVTDLAGHTSGGDMGLNANMPLDGFSNTHYTGQVGETGAMSSGEMFEEGGALYSAYTDNPLKYLSLMGAKTYGDLNYSTSKNGIDYYIGRRKDKYGDNKAIVVAFITDENNYMIDKEDAKEMSETAREKGVDKVELYTNYGVELRSTQKPQFLGFDKIVKVSGNYELGGGLPQGAEQSYVNYYLGEGTAQGIYKDGGSIPNNYEGRTAKDVWNNLSTSQRHHFLHDHNKSEIQSTPMSIEDFTKKSYNFLPTKVKKSFENHVITGQYAKGGGLGKAHYISNRDISGLTTKTGQRLKGSDLLDGAYTNKDIKTPKMSRTQFEDESYEYKNGGMFGGRTYQKGQPLINDRNHINASEKYEGHYASEHPNPKRGHYNKMKVARTQFENDTYEFEGGGSIDDANFSKFINAQVNHIISLKSVAQKKEPIRNLISNMDDYKGSDMLKRITTDNFKYALQQNTPSKINQVLRTSLNALKFEGGGSFEKPFNVLYKTKSGGTMVASRIMAKTEDEAKQKLIKQMSASNTFDKVLMVHESFENGGGFQSGVYLKGGNLALIKEQYEENEDDNAHSENVVLLAKHFGSSDELKEAKKILSLHNKEGYLTDENQLNRRTLSKKLIEKARKEMLKQNIKFANGGVTKNYVPRAELNTVTIIRNGKKLTYKISDVLNGAYALKNGGNIKNIAFYVAKRNVVRVQGKTGKQIKPANGYWIKKDAKPIHKMEFGGETTFQDKSNAIAKRFEGKRVEPKYQKEYGKVYSKEEAKEVGNKITGSMVSKEKMMSGGKTKQGNKGEAMQLAKKIRKDGEKWTDAVKRAWSQLK